nr:MAG TPA: hypothetical protein [Caudoviricetes sp.]
MRPDLTGPDGLPVRALFKVVKICLTFSPTLRYVYTRAQE